MTVIGIFSLPLIGCSDFLDKDNKSTANVDGNNYVELHPDALKATAFESLRNNILNVDMQDLASDLYTCPRKSNNGVFSQFSITASNDDVTKFFKYNSKSINYANGMIKFGGEGSRLAEEGRFIRSFCYYFQTQQFGSVPYVTYYVEDSNREYPKTPLDELYAALVADLTDLYNNSSLPATDRHGEISKQAVAALCARICLAAGWDLQTTLTNAETGSYNVTSTEYFDLAAQWAEKAINGTRLTMPFGEKWSPFNEGNDEVIWAIQYRRDGFPGDVNTSGHSLQNNYMGYYNTPNMSGQKGDKSGGANLPTSKSLRLFGEGDQRFDGTFMTTMYNSMIEEGSAVWGTQGYYAYYNVAQEELDKMPIAVKFFPWYTPVESVKSYLNAHKNQIVQFAEGVSGCNTPYAVILDPDGVVKFNFNPDGSYSQSSVLDYDTQYASVGSFNGMCVKKYDDPESIQSISGNDYRNVVVFHVSEMYLVAAEAYMMAGKDNESLAKLNEVRRRAGAVEIPSFGAYENMIDYSYPSTFGNIAKIDCILDEYAREMYAERTRWYDLRRTRQLVRYNVAFNRDINTIDQMSNAKGEVKWYRPIPETEINNNTAMTFEADQNPGY